MAWRDAREWFFKPREIVPLLAVGLLTFISLTLWGPKGAPSTALLSLAAIGAAAIVIPGLVYMASLATAPHRALRNEVVRIAAILEVPRLDRRSLLTALGVVLDAGIDRLEDYSLRDVDTDDTDEGPQSRLWAWERESKEQIAELLGIHEAAMFGSASAEIEQREPPDWLKQGVWSWHEADTKLRWLRLRIQEIQRMPE